MLEWQHETDIIYDRTKDVLFNCGYRYESTERLNRGRYQILKGCKDYTGINILLIYKTEWFLKFGEKLKDMGASGIGETINQEHLETAYSRGCRLVVRVQVEKGRPIRLYVMNLEDFRNKGIRWETKEPKKVVSISIHALKNLLDDEFQPVGEKTRFEMVVEKLKVSV